MIFRILNDVEFQFRGDKSSMPHNLISAITVRKMFRRRCQGCLAVVRDIKADKGINNNVSVVCEFPDVFLEELSGLSPEREI